MRVVDRRVPEYRLALAAVCAMAAAAGLLVWWRSGWTLEDACITARSVRNLVRYGELSYNLGDPVSSTTSPLFALIVALPTWLGVEPLVAAKVVGLLAFVLTAAIVFDLLCAFAAVRAAAPAAMAFALLPTAAAYSVSGMETPIYALACMVALERVARGAPRAAMASAAFAAMLRPDGVLVLLVVGVAVLTQIGWQPRRLAAVLWPVLLVPLMLILQHAYYGEWLPHSLLAKAGAYRIDLARNASRYLERMFLAQKAGLIFYALAALGAFAQRAHWRAWSPLAAWYLLYHVVFILRAPLFDWYLVPPLTALAFFAALGILALGRWAGTYQLRVQQVAGLGFATALGLALVQYADGRRATQRYETEVRDALGAWIGDQLPGQLVFTESLGFIGYANENPFVDWPGLATRDVPELLRQQGVAQRRMAAYEVIIERFDPAVLALREAEWDGLSEASRAPYRVCIHFPAPPTGGGPAYLVAAKACPP